MRMNEYGEATQDCLDIDQLNLTNHGLSIPWVWEEKILTNTGIPYFIAIRLLAEICYWYRPFYLKDPKTGRTTIHKRFQADLWQKRSSEWANELGVSRSTVTRALSKLEEMELIERQFRTIGEINDVQFIKPIAKNIKSITFTEDNNDARGGVQGCTGGCARMHSLHSSNIHSSKTSFSKEKEETFSRSAEATQEKEKSFENSSPVGASSPDDFSEIKIVKRKRNSASAVSQQSAEKEKKEDIPIIPERIRPLFDYWKSLGLHVPRENTKSFADCIASLRKFELGKIFKGLYDNGHVRCYTFDEWKTAVDNFHSALTDTDVYPVDKTKISSMTINKFLYDPFSQARHGKSNFLHYLHNEPESIRKPRLDLHPSVTNIIQSGFKKHVLGNGVNVKLPVDSINAFISTSDKIHKFYEDNKTLLIGDVGLRWTPTTLASRFWDMVLQNTKDISQMKAYYLSSDKMILELARYLKQNGYLKEKISYKL